MQYVICECVNVKIMYYVRVVVRGIVILKKSLLKAGGGRIGNPRK